MAKKLGSNEIKKIVQEMGGAEAIRQGSEQLRKNMKALERHYGEWLEQHPDKWIAIHQEKLVGIADDLFELLRVIDKKKIPREQVVVEFLATKRIPMILAYA